MPMPSVLGLPPMPPVFGMAHSHPSLASHAAGSSNAVTPLHHMYYHGPCQALMASSSKQTVPAAGEPPLVDAEGNVDKVAKAKVVSMIKAVPDFPKPGIVFRDITTLVEHPEGLDLTTDIIAAYYAARGAQLDAVVGCEARGFIWGATLARQLGVGLIVLRKKGKLPRETISRDYSLEYGSASLECHVDSITPGMRVVLVDDLLATGGTMAASVALVRELGADVVGTAFISDLPALGGRAKLEGDGIDVFSIVAFD